MAYIPDFNQSEYGVSGGGGSNEPVDPGKYPVVIESSEMSENSKKTGQILKIRMDIIDGPMKGRKIFDQLNIVNTNDIAQRIARDQLNGYKAAIGIPVQQNVKNSEELHMKPFLIEVNVRADDKPGEFEPDGRPKKFPPKNEVVQLYKIGGEPIKRQDGAGGGQQPATTTSYAQAQPQQGYQQPAAQPAQAAAMPSGTPSWRK